VGDDGRCGRLIANEHDGVFLLRTPSKDFSIFISPTICSAFNTRIAPMAGKADAARAALHKVKALHEDFHEPILAESTRPDFSITTRRTASAKP
jgi:hypothetical protein